MKKIIFSAIGILMVFMCVSFIFGGDKDPISATIFKDNQGLSKVEGSLYVALRPNGPGSKTRLSPNGDTPNWKCVDDVTPDDDATFVDKYGSTYFWDLYTLTDFTGSGTINKITVYFRCDYNGSDGWCIPLIRVEGIDYYGPEVTLTDEWGLYSKTWTKNPLTNSAWTAPSVNQLEAGIGLYGGYDSLARCTQVYVVVDYTPLSNFTETLRPNGPGSKTRLSPNGDTPNWKCVDDITPDDDATFVDKYGSTYFWDLYTLSDFSKSGTINKITLYYRCDYNGADGWCIPLIRVSGIDFYGSEVTLIDDWVTYSYTWVKNPNTNSPWSITDVNQLEAGIGLYGGYDSLARCTQIYVVVDYISDAPITIPTPQSAFALPCGSGQIYLGWRLSDSRPDINYNMYRSLTSGSGYTKLNTQPISNSTNYIDTTVTNGNTYYYVIRAVDSNGSESGNSMELSAAATSEVSNRYKSYSNFVPMPGIDNYCDIKIGDVDGDGLDDFLVAAADTHDANNNPNPYPTSALNVMLFKHDNNGTILWGPINTYIRWAGEFPWTLHDLNGDGKAEIIGLKFDSVDTDILRLVVMDYTGATLYQSNNVPHLYAPNDSSHVNRMNLTIGYLNGSDSSIIIICGTDPSNYNKGYENLAYNQYCNLVWRYTYADGDPYAGASHMIRAADLNLDGKDEVLSGTTVFTGTGSILWRNDWRHVDFVEPKEIRPDIPGLEVLMGSETYDERVLLFDQYGNLLWVKRIDPNSDYHAHLGWAANMSNNYPGLECYALFKKSSDPNYRYYFLEPTNGSIIESGVRPQPEYSQPIDWNGDYIMERHDQVIQTSLNPSVSGNMYVFVADVIGDYREEIIIFPGGLSDSPLTGELFIYTNTTLNTLKKQSTWTNRLYSESKKRTGYRD